MQRRIFFFFFLILNLCSHSQCVKLVILCAVTCQSRMWRSPEGLLSKGTAGQVAENSCFEKLWKNTRMRAKKNWKVLCTVLFHFVLAFFLRFVSLVLLAVRYYECTGYKLSKCVSVESHTEANTILQHIASEHRRELSKHISESCSANRSDFIPYETFQPNAAVFAQSFLVLCPCPVKRAWKANFVMCEKEYSLNLLHPKHAFYTFF